MAVAVVEYYSKEKCSEERTLATQRKQAMWLSVVLARGNANSTHLIVLDGAREAWVPLACPAVELWDAHRTLLALVASSFWDRVISRRALS